MIIIYLFVSLFIHYLYAFNSFGVINLYLSVIKRDLCICIIVRLFSRYLAVYLADIYSYSFIYDLRESWIYSYPVLVFRLAALNTDQVTEA